MSLKWLRRDKQGSNSSQVVDANATATASLASKAKDQGKTFDQRMRFSYKEQVSRSITWGHYFIFINILLACLLGVSYVYAAPPTNDFLSFFYLIVTWLGHMSFLTVVAYLVLFFPLSFIGNFRYYRVLCVCIAVIAHTILLFDIKIFLMVKVHLSMTAINLIVRELDFDTGLNYNFLFIAVPLVIAVECVFAKITTHSLYKSHHPHFVRAVLCTVGVCFISSHVLHIWADATQYERITLLRSTFPAHYPMTAKSFLTGHGFFNEDTLVMEPENGAEYLRYPLSKLEIADPSTANANASANSRTDGNTDASDSNVAMLGADTKPTNILLITINGLSYGNLSADITPELLKFKQEAQSFEEHYLLYPQEIDNVYSMTYGLPLQYRRTMFSSQILPVTLDELFRQDYVCRVILSSLSVAQDEGSLLDDWKRAGNAANKDNESSAASAASAANTDNRTNEYQRSRSDAYSHELVRNSGLRQMQLTRVADVEAVFDQALKQIELYQVQEQRPYALTLTINDLRDFYQRQLLRHTIATEEDPLVQARMRYEKTLSEVDAAFGAFIEQMREQGLLEHTVVMVTSAEGNSLLEGEGMGAPRFNRDVQHVPMFILWPDKSQIGTSVNLLSSPQDLSATIAAEILHITTPSGNFTLGRNMRELIDREYLIADGANELILIGKKDNTIYSQDGASFIERQGERLQVRPDLESLIESMRDLNRFLR